MKVLEDTVLERACEIISRYNMFPGNARVAVAVSGGADSVCLLHVLRELAPRFGLTLSVAHVDHGIRGAAAAEDAEFVRALSASLDLPFHFHRAAVPALASSQQDNLEQAARNVRHAFFLELLRSGVADRIATGHTRSDQAETVLYRMVRGSGLAGLAGIHPVTADGLVRPLLGVGRADVETYLRSRGIPWREDETNRDLNYARNRIRHEILPLIRKELNPRADEALAQTAILAHGEEAYWNSEAKPLESRDGVLLLGVERIAAAPSALARRLVRQAIQTVKGDLRQIEFQHVEAVLEMIHSALGSGRTQVPGVDVFRSFDLVRFAPTGHLGAIQRDFEIPVAPPGRYALPRCSTVLSLDLLQRNEGQPACVRVGEELDWQKILDLPELPGGSLELRNWRPGDKLLRAGQNTEQKIKTLFQEARIPLWERRNWPVLACRGQILWTRRFGAASHVAATQDCRVILRVTESA